MMINWILKDEMESLLDKKENWFGLWNINWEIEIIFWVHDTWIRKPGFLLLIELSRHMENNGIRIEY